MKSVFAKHREECLRVCLRQMGGEGGRRGNAGRVFQTDVINQSQEVWVPKEGMRSSPVARAWRTDQGDGSKQRRAEPTHERPKDLPKAMVCTVTTKSTRRTTKQKLAQSSLNKALSSDFLSSQKKALSESTYVLFHFFFSEKASVSPSRF